MLPWIELLICTVVIVFSGAKLSKYGDIIAEKTGLGRAWTGLVLMAAVTSLPELVTGISSVTFAGLPDIAVGDVLGSCVFNMLILAVLDIVHRQTPICTKAHHGHILAAGFGIILLNIVCTATLLGDRMPSFGWIGVYSIINICVYVVAMRLVFSYEKRKLSMQLKEMAEDLKYGDVRLEDVVVRYCLNAVFVITAAMFLPGIGGQIAAASGLGQTFVGNVFIALSTSLPEVVVSLAAVRIGAVDLAIGNLFGSNIFNILILSLDDIFFMKGPLLAFASHSHIISALSAIVMTSIAIIGLIYRTEKKRMFLAWDSAFIISVYATNLLLLYMLK
jgi:cation:H+ antiporter